MTEQQKINALEKRLTDLLKERNADIERELNYFIEFNPEFKGRLILEWVDVSTPDADAGHLASITIKPDEI